MDYIEEILSPHKTSVAIMSNIITDYRSKSIRYDLETSYLRFIIINQLNLPKNRVKGKLESHDIDQLFCLLIEEVYELKEELLNLKDLNAHRILSEAGDIGAFLVGIIAKIIQESKNENNSSLL